MRNLTDVVIGQLVECGLSLDDVKVETPVSMIPQRYRSKKLVPEYGSPEISLLCGHEGLPRILPQVNALARFFEVTLVVRDQHIEWIHILWVSRPEYGKIHLAVIE